MLSDGTRHYPQNQRLDGVQQGEEDPADQQHRQEPDAPDAVDEQHGAVPEQGGDPRHQRDEPGGGQAGQPQGGVLNHPE